MPNGETHRLVGMAAGGGYALYRARAQTPGCLILEAVGGVVGGNIGGRLPDIFEPALHPRHRSLAHGLGPVGGAGYVAISALDGAQDWLRAQADRRAILRANAQTVLEGIWHALLELLCRLGAGALAGFVGGYASHVALDACTPNGCPIIC